MSGFSDAAVEAKRLLDDIVANLELITTRQRLHASASEVISWEGISSEAKQVLADFFSAKTTSPDTLYRGLYVQFGSVLEAHIKKCTEEAATLAAERAETYDDLPDEIRRTNLVNSGRALQTLNRGIPGREINYDEISRKLGTCTPGNSNFELNISCFSLFIGNCTSLRVAELLEEIGVPGDVWQELAKSRVLRAHFKSTQTNETQKLAIGALDEYVRIRNGIMHTGEAAKTVTENELLDSANYLNIRQSWLIPSHSQPFFISPFFYA